MVRPLQGERPKKTTTISIDPEVWQTFQNVVKTKEPDGDVSASSHVETLAKREIAKLTGQNADADVATEAQLRKRLATLERRLLLNRDLLIKGDGDYVDGRVRKLVDSYKLDREHYSNGEEVIRNILIDSERWNSPVQRYFDEEGDLTEFNLLIENIQLHAEIAKVNDALLEARKKQYNITLEEIKAAKDAADAERAEREREEKAWRNRTAEEEEEQAPEESRDEDGDGEDEEPEELIVEKREEEEW